MLLKLRHLFPILMLSLGLCHSAAAQGVVIQRSGTPAGQTLSIQSTRSSAQSESKPASNQPGTEAKPGEKGKVEGKDPKAEEATPKTIQRIDYKPQPYIAPIPVEEDGSGKVKFNFHGTPWPVVLDWLARYARLNLDWQELPGDYLNLRTQQAYTATEAQDLVNRHLLARGFTLLQHGELLTVAKIQGLNPGLVPRVAPADLLQRMPHDYVKVSLPLEWILADEAVEQLKPMLSPNGQLNAISAVNRLEAMDVAVNLQEVYQLLTDEQSAKNTEQGLVREFKLQHVRAVNVIDSLYAILGVKKPQSLGGGSGDISGSMSMQIMQQLQQMQQRQSQQGNNSKPGKEDSEPKLVLNERENSILAHASPDKMEIISQTIKAMDVPTQRSGHILQNLDRMKVYRLSTLKPDPLLKILSEIGDLSPTTKLQVDSENNSLIVYGTLADHITVQSLVERLDGSSRNFEVIPLRRIRARDVAGTIQYMLGEEEKKEDDNRSRYFSYYSYSQKPETKKEDRPFRVDADVENNRLLVWANEVELEEIQNLLIKMGEIPTGQVNPATSRTIDLYSEEEAQKVLDRIQRVWQQGQSNELKIESPSPPVPVQEGAEQSSRSKAGMTPKSLLHFATETNSSPLPQAIDSTTERSASPPSARDASSPPPVTIRQLPHGKLSLESKDPRALDELEFLISELAPPAPNYKIFEVKYAWPFGIELILIDFFESNEDEENTLDWWGNPLTLNKKEPDRLSTQRKLKIISDSDSRTILVQGASAQQLAIIQELISIYDKPESSDPQSVRITKVFHLEYSKATPISETVKSVYRDLLSANDPALQKNQKEGQPQQPTQGITYAPFRQNQGDSAEKEQPQEPIKFKGLLSIGVDEISNTIVVSSASGLMDAITELIEVLDLAAKPETTVRVLSINPAISPSFLRERLHQSFGISGNVKVSSTANRTGNKARNSEPNSAPAANGGQPANP